MTPQHDYATLQTSPPVVSVATGQAQNILAQRPSETALLVLILPQLGDFDSLEYAWWLRRDWEALEQRKITLRAVGIGDRASGQKFCHYTGLPETCLFVDGDAKIHRHLDLYSGITWSWPGLTAAQSAWLNLMVMCAGIKSPGTLKEVARGYLGDRQAPQLIGDQEEIIAKPLPPLKGDFFKFAGGRGYQRPFELATLRLRNMGEVLSHWQTYVPNGAYLTQRGGTFLFDRQNQLRYCHRDRGILDFAENKSQPLSFLTVLDSPGDRFETTLEKEF